MPLDYVSYGANAYTPPTPAQQRVNWLEGHPEYAMANYMEYRLYIARATQFDATAYGGDDPLYSIMVTMSEGSPFERQYVSTPFWGNNLLEAVNYIETYMNIRQGQGDTLLYGTDAEVSGTLQWSWVGSIDNCIADDTVFAASQHVMRYRCADCVVRLPVDEMVQCNTCHTYRCGAHAPAHAHLGPHCFNCGYDMVQEEENGWCDYHDAAYCDTHQFMHEYCGEEPEYEEDDYYSGSRPSIPGFGREASLNYLDEPYVEHPILRMTRAAAAELEAEYVGGAEGQSLVFDPNIGVGNDGSLSNGIEVTLPPSRGATLAAFMENACSNMINAGFEAQESCGMHVHIDMRDKVEDKRFLAHLFNAFFSTEDILYAMQQNDRKHSEYSVPLRHGYKFYEMYGQEVDTFDFNFYKQEKSASGQRWMDSEKSRKYASPRYYSFNFHSMYFRGSLECRIHEGSLNANDALRWIDLLERIVARVEKGHSYEFMRRMVKLDVTPDKVRAFCRYFKIPRDTREWMLDKINRGQGYNYSLGEFKWGKPKKGRAKKVAMFDNIPHVNKDVACNRCAHQFRMRRTLERCPNCRRRLLDPYGDAWYSLVVPDQTWQYSSSFATLGQEINSFASSMNDLNDIFEPYEPGEF